jgi:hypothetical protein
VSGQGRVQPDLPDLDSIEAHFLDSAREGVHDARVHGAAHGVIADEERGRVRGVDAVHHGQGARRAHDQAGALVELLGQQIEAHVVRIRHGHIHGPGLEGAANGRVDLVCHQAARQGVFAAVHAGVFVAGNAAHTFDVCADIDFHGVSLRILLVKMTDDLMSG